MDRGPANAWSGGELSAPEQVGSVLIVADGGFSGAGCAAQLSELLALLERARNLFGDRVVDLPEDIVPDVDAAGKWVD